MAIVHSPFVLGEGFTPSAHRRRSHAPYTRTLWGGRGRPDVAWYLQADDVRHISGSAPPGRPGGAAAPRVPALSGRPQLLSACGPSPGPPHPAFRPLGGEGERAPHRPPACTAATAWCLKVVGDAEI